MPVNNIPLINGKAYTWSSVALMIAGAPLVGYRAIDYDDTEAKANGYGGGKYPIERGDGRYEARASITLTASEVEALADKAPNGRLQDFGVFDIIVSFLVGTIRKTHKIRNCEFTNNRRSMREGDTSIEVELELIVSHIEWK